MSEAKAWMVCANFLGVIGVIGVIGVMQILFFGVVTNR